MTFSDEDIYQAIKHHLPEVNAYVNSHGGDIKLLCVKDGVVYIELIGTCSGCSMSLMTTKMVVQRRLRELIHPELEVVNIEPHTQDLLPTDGCYKE
jgi:Fe-S cluster biogenesis protein NfuA